MLKVILFDIDNTLLSFDKFVIETMKNGFREFGLCEYKDNMFNVFNQINSGLWQQLENKEISFEELKKKRWNMIFERLGISSDGEAFEEYFRGCLLESAIPIDGAFDLLEYLHKKYILCVASNGPYMQQMNRLKISGMLPYFSDLFISEDIGASKPSENFFNVCLTRLNSKLKQNILPREIMIVGDSLTSDIAGGIYSGIKTCFYNPNNKSIPSEMTPDYHVSSLSEIKSII
jgi:YjjG family noncanonical pyrimidine nucleotidase